MGCSNDTRSRALRLHDECAELTGHIARTLDQIQIHALYQSAETLMALVDTLPYVPKDDPHHAVLLALLHRTCAAVAKAQDPQSSLWYQILGKPGEKGNYIESSSVLMFTYAFAKGARLGYLPASYEAAAARAWKAVQSRFVRTTASGQVEITGTVTHVALGATPKDDGSFDYYLRAPVVNDDPKGVGAFLLAGSEMELRGA